MANNQYVNKVNYGNNTVIDLTADTATADKVLRGYTFHDKSGAPVTGTAGASVSGTKLIIPSGMGSVSNNTLSLV